MSQRFGLNVSTVRFNMTQLADRIKFDKGTSIGLSACVVSKEVEHNLYRKVRK